MVRAHSMSEKSVASLLAKSGRTEGITKAIGVTVANHRQKTLASGLQLPITLQLHALHLPDYDLTLIRVLLRLFSIQVVGAKILQSILG